MAGDKEQPQKIVAKVLLVGGVEFGFIVCHGGFLLGIEFAADLFVLPLQKLAAAKMIQSAMLGGGHQPCAGIVRYTGAGPLLERGDQSVLREFFGQAHVADDTCKCSDDSGGLNAPDSIDCLMRRGGSVGAGGGFSGHGRLFFVHSFVQGPDYEKERRCERAAASVEPKYGRRVSTLSVRRARVLRRRGSGFVDAV